MGIKISRNDLCPCGSGKKYKTCCYALQSPQKAQVIDFAWRRLRQLEGTVFDQHLLPYISETLPKDVMEKAASDYFPDELPGALDRALFFTNFFLPWVLFHWWPGDDFAVEGFSSELSLARNYVNLHENKLNRQEKHFIDAMSETYYSFYSVEEVEKEKSVFVKDILLGTLHTVKERQGTHYLKRGDIVFSRILTLDKQSIFVGMAPVALPGRYHHLLLDFKDWVIEENEGQALTSEALRQNFDLEAYDYFFEVLEVAYHNPLPTLVNTDDELMLFSKSHFTLTMRPEEALAHLLPLTLSNNPDEFLHDAKRTAAGEIEQIELSWLKKGNEKHKEWNNTVLGDISIKRGQLILETNSENRTEEGKALIRQYLGDAVLFQQTVFETPEQKLQSLPSSERDKRREEHEEFMKHPEIQAQLQAMAKAHWQSWFDEPIPALNNQTPRQSAKTEKGRERLAALLLQYECHDVEAGDNPFKADIAYLKSELAID